MPRIAWHPGYAHPLPPGHRFPMEKYDLVVRQLLWEGTASEADLVAPEPCAEADVLRAHDADWWARLRDGRLDRQEERRIGFPWSPLLVERERRITQGSIDGARHALRHGVALNAAGGTHHAGRAFSAGFCLLNDVAVALHALLAEGLIRRALVVDLDVHQGDGTADVFAGDPRVFTFSMHGARNFPHRKVPSDLDLALPDGTGDEAYLALVRRHVPDLIRQTDPDLVWYLSGVDVLAVDRLGRLALTREGCRQRDALVFDACLAADRPVAVSLGGGYAPRLADIIEAHANTFRLAADRYGG